MATNPALAEFAKKSTTYKIGVFVGIGVLLGALYFQFGWKSLKEKRQSARDQHDSLVQRSAQLEKDAKDYKIQLAKRDELQHKIEENQKALPTDSEMSAFLETLNRKFGEAGVDVKKWDIKKDVTLDNFVKVPMQIELTGTFYQIKRFFASLVQREDATSASDGAAPERERIVTIEDLQLSDPKVTNREIVLTARFVASTFKQSAPADSATPGTPGAASPPGAATPAPVPTPPPANPINQIDQAKQKTNAAMQQSVDRAAGTPATAPAPTPSPGALPTPAPIERSQVGGAPSAPIPPTSPGAAPVKGAN